MPALGSNSPGDGGEDRHGTFRRSPPISEIPTERTVVAGHMIG